MKTTIFIGNSHLLVQLAKRFLASRLGTIASIVSSDPIVCQWAKDEALPLYPTLIECEVKLTSIDYLFSIVNYQSIPDHILKKVNGWALNYHNSLLPRYAGLNSTTWAILAGEVEHGISWHTIATGIDTGDIVYQARFPVDETATAFELNLLAAEKAASGFDYILSHLKAGTLSACPQNKVERTYFGATALPDNGGFITPDMSFTAISRLLRALDFGDSANTVTTPKLQVNGMIYCITGYQLQENTGQSVSQILALTDEKSLLLQAEAGQVRITGLAHLTGGAQSLAPLHQRRWEQVSVTMPSAFSDHFAKKMQQTYGVPLPLLPLTVSTDSKITFDHDIDESILVACLLSYLAMIGFSKTVSVDVLVKVVPEADAALVSYCLPITVSARALKNQATQALAADIKKMLTQHQCYQHDIGLRYHLPRYDKQQAVLVNLSGCATPLMAHYGLTVTPQKHTITLTRLFDGAGSFATALQHALQQLLDVPSRWMQPIATLSPVTSAAMQKKLATWGRGKRQAVLAEARLWDAFLCQVARTPSQEALVFNDKRLTYSELQQEALRLAEAIQAELPAWFKKGDFTEQKTSENV